MKIASLFIPVLAVAMPIAPANAEKNRKVEDTYKCSTYYVASCEDGDGQGLASLRCLVGVQQSGVQKLTNPLNC